MSCLRWQPEVLPWGTPHGVDTFCGLDRKPCAGPVNADNANAFDKMLNAVEHGGTDSPVARLAELRPGSRW